MAKIHKYFTIEEMCRSNTATKKGIKNVPTADIVDNLDELIEHVLDPLREAWGMPIRVNSGYRCARLNKAVGGVANSQHMKGEAADITVGTKRGNQMLYEYIRTNLEYDQLINESNFAWVHVSYRKKNRKQAFSISKK